MSITKKRYRNGSTRGGTSPKATDTGFGAKANKNTSKKNYAIVAAKAGFR